MNLESYTYEKKDIAHIAWLKENVSFAKCRIWYKHHLDILKTS